MGKRLRRQFASLPKDLANQHMMYKADKPFEGDGQTSNNHKPSITKHTIQVATHLPLTGRGQPDVLEQNKAMHTSRM